MLPKSKARSSAKAVQRAALSLQRIDDVHGGDGLSLGVLSVGHRIADDILQEDLQHATGLLVDEAADALDAAAAGQSADGRLRDALDVVAEDLSVALGASLPQALASLAAARHVWSKIGGGGGGGQRKVFERSSRRELLLMGGIENGKFSSNQPQQTQQPNC
ncbi:hypothetical protein TYRP_013789 [Tyrophagus putrescentiae]|nr:hypothetical protein TYRP_013789 [Tyrophagus putrescentiae]